MKFNTHIIFLLLFVCLSLGKIHVLGKNSESASNSSYILSCGSSNGGIDADGRRWESDSKYANSSGNSTMATAQYQDPTLPSQIPYMSARIFPAQFSYIFSILPNSRHWLRLHFYPSSYGSLRPDDAYFSVVANGMTLLNNFSAAITAKALLQTYIIREFSLVSSQAGTLNLIFSPSPQHARSYAFVSGIEIIPMPEIFLPSVLIGFDAQTVEVGSCTLQTMFRLNVGGAYIAASNDSALGRTWYDDSPYLFGAGFGVTSAANDSVKIQYSSNVTEMTAPIDVYSTARSMGPTPEINLNYNLSWVFQVDANFTYVVRFHFCEFLLEKVNQRVFDIFVNNQTAQQSADVIGWAGSRGVPVFKDYATYVADSPGDEELFVALHPSVTLKPQFYDAILNGLEIFKINDSNANLAGPNPVRSDMLILAESPKNSASSGSGVDEGVIGGGVAGGVAGGAAGCAVLAAACFVVYHKKRRTESGIANWLPLYSAGGRSASSQSTASSRLSNLAGGLCRHFSLAEIKNGTKNFDESQVIGVGGFGNVYRGTIDGGTKVAIKRSNPSSQQGVDEFQTEIEMLSKLRHRHLVSLIGFCEEDGEMILVYDYMANGTLREHLYKSNKPPLSWIQRLEICIGAARGLHYLHTGAKYKIIHRDVKTTNILLDENWVAKVSDFGLSKTSPDLNQTHVSTVVKGSFGYLDPEYFRRQQLTEKSDVYSFGVVILEALCGRPALVTSLPKEQVSLADWALLCRRKGTLEQIVDPHIMGQISSECFNKFAGTAEQCLADNGLDRPSMGDVLWNLEFALQLQEDPAGGRMVAEEKANVAYALHGAMMTLEEESAVSERTDPESAFSLIVNPAGR